MKKFFIIMAALGLGLGFNSCTKGPGGGNDGGGTTYGEGETGLKVNLLLPGAGGDTRYDSGDVVVGSQAESKVHSVYVFVFTNDGGPNQGKRVATGGYTSIVGEEEFILKFAETDPQPTNGGVSYTMIQPIVVTSGDVKVWVAINLPSTIVSTIEQEISGSEAEGDDKLTGYATESDMLANIAAITGTASLTNADATDAGFTMYSIGIPKTLVPQTGAEVPDANVFDAPVDRAVAKIVASHTYTSPESATTGYLVKWEGITEDVVKVDYGATNEQIDDVLTDEPFTSGEGGDLTLAYFPSHWFVFQDVAQSYVAPHPLVGGRPDTYRGIDFTYTKPPTPHPYPDKYPSAAFYTNIYHYQQSVSHQPKAHELAYLEDGTDDDEIAAPGENTFQYIGENATPTGENARRHLSTIVVLSTYVKANAYARWDNTITDAGGQSNDLGKGDVVWVKEEWGGNGFEDADDEDDGEDEGDDIHVLILGGKKYFTKAEYVKGIVDGYVFREAARRGFHIIPDVYIDGDSSKGLLYDVNNLPAQTTYPGTEIYQSDFLELEANADLNITEFIYRKGYVHFWNFVQMDAGETAADLLRNQLIHMEIEGIDDTEDYTFIGYPGQNPKNDYGVDGDIKGDPRKPIDFYGDENNPNPLVPGAVVPEKTTMQVNVVVRPWTYQKNKVTLHQ